MALSIIKARTYAIDKKGRRLISCCAPYAYDMGTKTAPAFIADAEIFGIIYGCGEPAKALMMFRRIVIQIVGF
jgi:hypothetical protein